MPEFLQFMQDWSPVAQALVATLFTWGVTALGASSVFFFRTYNQKVMDGLLGFAAGVMIAASYWSLLAPGIELAEQQGVTPWVPAVVGFLLGGVFMRLVDMTLPHMHMFTRTIEGPESTWRRSMLLVSAVTIHNIPEGLAVGVAFGAASLGLESASIAGAATLALGIGLQNFPEGIAVSMPLRREGMSRLRCFGWGQFSGMVEPIAGVIGAATVLLVRPLLPYALSFAAGAMIFVVAEELIPESQEAGNVDLATGGVMLGFAVMMTLDVALG